MSAIHLLQGRRVIVEYVAPPIPVRGFDYCASFVDNDQSDPQGYGETRQEALRDLIDKVEDDK